ncbi:hypothetical protein J2W42_000822 [Rhizobium tibeticum]|nr:hypothetical protein [Rhizobium tibeticum]
MFFEGLWVPQWKSVRKVKDGPTTDGLSAFLIPCRMILRKFCCCYISYRSTNQSANTEDTSVSGTQTRPNARK